MSYRQLKHQDFSNIALSNDSPRPISSASEHSSAAANASSGRESDAEDIELTNIKSHKGSVSDLDDGEWDSEELKFPGGHDEIPRRASASTVQSFTLYTPDEERSVVRKFDRRLVVFIAALYMLSFLDRSSAAMYSIAINVSNLLTSR